MEKIKENKQVKKIFEILFKEANIDNMLYDIETYQDVIDLIEGIYYENPFESVKEFTIEERLVLGFCIRELTADRKGKGVRYPDISDICTLKENTQKAYEYLIQYTFDYLDNVMNWENPDNPAEIVSNNDNFVNFKWYLKLFLETIPYNHNIITKDVKILRSMTNYPSHEIKKYEGKPHKMRSTVMRAKSGIGALLHEIRMLEKTEADLAEN